MEQANFDSYQFYVDFSDFISSNASFLFIFNVQKISELILYSSPPQKQTFNHFCKSFSLKIFTFG